MKQLLIILMVCFVGVGCKNGAVKETRIIKAKSYLTFFNNPMPDGICRYFVDGQEFMDSCNKYSVGDTIVGKRK